MTKMGGFILRFLGVEHETAELVRQGVDTSDAERVRAKSRLEDTIREMMERNDVLTGRPLGNAGINRG